jgi:N-acetylglucosaminyl-diphospho-decaprenol L-rhamnosyltransferase
MTPAAGPRLAVVTVLYRSRAILAKTLPTWVDSARGGAVAFVFVDHAPDDGCGEVVAGCLDESAYRYLPDASNPGFAAGCNRAVAAVTAPHVLLLNPDVWLSGDALSRVLAAVAAAPDTPFAVSLTMRGGEYAGVGVHPLSLFRDRPAGARRRPLGPSGGAAVFPTAVFRRFGGFHEDLFAWGEDADLAYRLYASGVRTRTLGLGLPHEWGHSVDGDRALNRLRAFLLARNRLLVAARTYTWPLLLLALPVLAVGHCGLALRRARQGLLRPFLNGVGQGLVMARGARRTWPGTRFGLACMARYMYGEEADGRFGR